MVVIAWLILAVSCSFGKTCTFENEAKTENGTVHFCDGDLQQSCPNGALCQYSDIRYANVCCHEISTDYFKRKPLQKTNGKRFRQQEVYLDPVYRKPLACNQYLSYSTICPIGYDCITVDYLSGTYCGKNVGKTNSQLVCPNFEYPYFTYGSLIPAPCDPNQLRNCPAGYLCRFSPFYKRTICCKPYPGYLF